MNKRIWLIVVIAFMIFLVASTFISAEAKTKHYIQNNISIEYENEADLKKAINAIEKIEKLFRKMGYTAEKQKINIIFQDAVYLTLDNNEHKQRVYAIADCENNTIYVSSWGTEYLHNGSRLSLGLPVDKVLHESIIVHELAHAYAYIFSINKLSHGIQEYIAYVMQILSLPESYRVKIFDVYRNVDEFDYDDQINSLVHNLNPKKFGIKSYLHFMRHGDRIFHDIIQGKFDPDKYFGVAI